MATFLSGGHQVSIAEHLPKGAGPFPAVIVVHGSGGPRTAVEQYTPMLTRAGYCVFVVHYFERTETAWATPHLIDRHFPEWLEVLRDAALWVADHEMVDEARIGLMGVSLGAFLSLSLASMDSRIAAVVDMFGGIPEFFAEKARSMPPVLILHGEEDPVVSVQEARKLEALLKRLGTQYEAKIYAGHGHALRGIAAWDAAQRIFRFLEANLKHASARDRGAESDKPDARLQ
jgi:carboxymethylenebutenolidase